MQQRWWADHGRCSFCLTGSQTPNSWSFQLVSPLSASCIPGSLPHTSHHPILSTMHTKALNMHLQDQVWASYFSNSRSISFSFQHTFYSPLQLCVRAGNQICSLSTRERETNNRHCPRCGSKSCSTRARWCLCGRWPNACVTKGAGPSSA